MINPNYQLKNSMNAMRSANRAPKMNKRTTLGTLASGMATQMPKAVTRAVPSGPQIKATRSNLISGPQTKATRNMTKMNNMSKKIMKNLPQKAFSMARKMK